MTPAVIWSARHWADAIAALPTEGALPTRTVLVPREAVAHSLRRELIRSGQAAALVGTRFYASREALGHDVAKARLVESGGDILLYKHAISSITSADGSFRLHGGRD